MMLRHTAARLSTALLTVALLPAVLEGQADCIGARPDDVSPWVRQPGQVRVLATATGSRAVSVPMAGFGGLRVTMSLAVVRVREVLGEAGPLAPGGEALVAQYEARFGGLFICDGGPFDASLAPAEYVITGSLRSPEDWIDGIPTIDVTRDQLNLIGGRQPGEPLPPELWDLFSRVMPEQEEWARDCRIGVRRVREWLESRPALREYLSAEVEPYPLRYRPDLREDCSRIAANEADALLRWGPDEPPPELARALQQNGCTEPPEDWHYAPGTFENRAGWAFLCATREGWRLLVLSSDDPGSARELVRMTGQTHPFMVASAPPEYFGWSDSPDFARGVERPTQDVVLLFTPAPKREAASFDEPHYAFFRSGAGWVRVTVECCREPQ